MIIRVAVKNNFNMTNKEHAELKKYEGYGKIFVNSNAFTKIKSTFPSIVTINPYMKFVPLRGDLSNVKAVRIKAFIEDGDYVGETEKCVKFCIDNNLKMLVTHMRYKSKKTAEQFSGPNFGEHYKFERAYMRPTTATKKYLTKYIKDIVRSMGGKVASVKECDSKGGGCPECMNCVKLTYGLKAAKIEKISELNLSISGIKDKKGKRGKCPYKCPNCFAKLVTFGNSPGCDRILFTNSKQNGFKKK